MTRLDEKLDWLLEVLSDFDRVDRTDDPPGVMVWRTPDAEAPFEFHFAPSELVGLAESYAQEDQTRGGSEPWAYARSVIGQDFADAMVNASPNEGPWVLSGDEFVTTREVDQGEWISRLRRLGSSGPGAFPANPGD